VAFLRTPLVHGAPADGQNVPAYPPRRLCSGPLQDPHMALACRLILVNPGLAPQRAC